MNSANPQPTDCGFADAFDDIEVESWKPSAPVAAPAPKPARQEVEKIARRSGFSSREPRPAPRREPEGQINIRAKQSVLDRFRDFGRSQTPRWPSGYVLERALEALEREMKAEG